MSNDKPVDTKPVVKAKPVDSERVPNDAMLTIVSNDKPVDVEPVVKADPVDSEQVPNDAMPTLVSHSIITESNIFAVAKRKAPSPGSESSSSR